MFCSDPACTYRITGIFCVERAPKTEYTYSCNRKHTAISYRIRGSAAFDLGKRQLTAGDGSVTYIPPGVDYGVKNDAQEKLIILHLQRIGGDAPDFEVVENAFELEPLFFALLKSWEEGGPASYNRSMAQLYAIFEALQRKREPPITASVRVLAPGLELLRRNFRDHTLTVSKLAGACFVSEVYFRRLYREAFGCTPMQTILELRFSYACTLLRAGYYTCRQAAEMAGFADVKYFRTAFRRRFGITPTQYAAGQEPQISASATLTQKDEP